MEKNENFKEELETQYSILIKINEKKEQQRYIILLVVLAITFISVIISVIFSYKALSATKKINNNDNTNIVVNHQYLTTTFNNGSNLNITNIGNGYSLKVPKVIKVLNEGNTEVIFDIKLTSIKTSLLSTNNLVYTITRNGETSIPKELPLNDRVIAEGIKILPKESIVFSINVRFDGIIEADNYTNYYNSKIVIEQKNNKTNLLE